MTILTYILLGVCFLLLSAFFSSMETSIFSLSIAEQNEQTKKNKSLRDILSHLNNALIAILFANTFVNIGFSLSIDKISYALLGQGTVSVVLSILIATILVLVFGEVLPKNFAIFHKYFFIKNGSSILNIITRLLTPITLISKYFVSFFINRMRPFVPKGYPKIMKDELLSFAGTHRKKSFLNTTEKYLLQNITKIHQLNAGDIATPRVHTNVIDLAKSEKEINVSLKKFKHKFVPAYRKNIDNIKGIIDVKSYFLSKESYKKHLQRPFFAPETKKILPLMQEMKEKRVPLSVIVDEYGGFVGIVTMEDIVEEITGDISDEFDTEESTIKRLKPGLYLVPGDTRLGDIEEITYVRFEGDLSDTLNAYIQEKYGVIPQKGNQYKLAENIHLVISKASRTKVIEVEIKVQ